jgi:malate dehydrogenase (oxaloacetate-decarboxylating)(NADP+)
MEGKGLLFKIFSDIDVFDIEVDATNIDEFVRTVKNIAPTFGGINLEDIKAPEAFEIEERLKAELDIPVMHDDQHGTAIISSAALINALELTDKKIEDVKIVVNGAGAAAIMCARLYVKLGAKLDNILMLDSKGVINTKRGELPESKEYFRSKSKLSTLEEAIVGADVFLGLSKGNVLSKDMVRSMAVNPIVFALANPVAEISYEEGIASRDDIIMATGRSDYPNQVNNVLGFPYIFRGALDVRATSINEEMKLAAVYALAELTKEPVPEEVVEAYNETNIIFSKDYIIPKPLDHRLITRVAPAVAKAAMDSGVALNPINDWDAYKRELQKRLGLENTLMKGLERRARRDPQRIVLAEGHDVKVLKAAQTVAEQGIAKPILLGLPEKINMLAEEFGLDLSGCEIIDARCKGSEEMRNHFGQMFFDKRKRKGLTLSEGKKLMRERNYFAAGMLEAGMADAVISGLTRNYPDTIRPALQVLGKDEDALRIVGMYVVITKRGPIFFADTTINFNPTAEELVDITIQVDEAVKRMKIKPAIAMLSYSNFGSSSTSCSSKVTDAVAILHKHHPEILVDGEMQANFALDNELLEEIFPFSQLVNEKVNTLIFPNLGAGNIAYKLTQELASTDSIGPILLGMNKPFHVLQLGSTVREIINMVKVASIDAQAKKKG